MAIARRAQLTTRLLAALACGVAALLSGGPLHDGDKLQHVHSDVVKNAKGAMHHGRHGSKAAHPQGAAHQAHKHHGQNGVARGAGSSTYHGLHAEMSHHANTGAAVRRLSCMAPYRQELQNDDDVSFIGKIKMGSQVLNVIPDTGSYELVIFSDECAGCGNRSLLYHDNMSKTLRTGPLQAKQSYGSGITTSTEAYDDVHMGCLAVKQQMFWRVVRATMPILQAGSFQGIFGLGPPRSNVRMAEQEVSHVKAQMDRMEHAGINVEAYMPTLDNLRDVHEFSKTEKLWLRNLRMRSFSICLMPGAGRPGVFVYNDDMVERHPSQFTSVSNVGNMYWSTKMAQVKIGEVDLDCSGDDSCIAIMDTGTSLIAAPSDVVKTVESLINALGTDGSNCENMDAFPDLQFTLDGKLFTLPPQAYVGVVEGDAPEWALELMPSLKRVQELRRSQWNLGANFSYCSLLLMNLGEGPDDGGSREWILGLPFFRKYYTTFHLDSRSQRAQSMHMAEANDVCEVDGASSLRIPRSLPTPPLRIDVSKLRPPRRWAKQHREKYGISN